jgi:hypothetical protein
MKRFHPSPSLVISLIALFVALGGTSYAAITSLPANSVGTKQLKNFAVTGAKLNRAVLKNYFHAGGVLPSGKTEVGDWGAGGIAGADGGGEFDYPIISFPVPLAAGLDDTHTVFVSGSSATHCSGVGSAAPGYLCVYLGVNNSASTPGSAAIFNPEGALPTGTGRYGFGIVLGAAGTGAWSVSGSYAVTAP